MWIINTFVWKKNSNFSSGMKSKIGFQLNATEAVKMLLNRLAVMITKTILEMILKCGILFFPLSICQTVLWLASLFDLLTCLHNSAEMFQFRENKRKTKCLKENVNKGSKKKWMLSLLWGICCWHQFNAKNSTKSWVLI